MNIDKIIEAATILKGLNAEHKPESQPGTPWHPVITIGAMVEIRTPVFFWTGIVTHYDGTWVTIKNVAWIADEGRMTEAMETCEFSEVEVYPPDRLKSILVTSIVDVSVVTKIPKSQK